MSQEIIKLMLQGIQETFYMVAVAIIIGGIIGIPLGITLVTTSKGHILENRFINQILGTIVNIIRSIPFIILMVAIIPLTRLIAGTSIGTTGSLPSPDHRRHPLPEPSRRNVHPRRRFRPRRSGRIHGGYALQVIRKVLIPEALPTIINNITVLIVNLIGASAMAGAIGGGGLGDIAIRYGYQRFRPDVMLATIIILIVVVNVIQAGGDFASRKKNKK